MEHHAPTLHEELLRILDDQVDRPGFVTTIEKLVKAHGSDTYAELIAILASIKLQPLEAEALWKAAWDNMRTLTAQLGRPVNMIVALLDYVMTHREYLSQPKVIDVMEYERVAQSAIRDGLTGIYNPGYIREQVEWELMKDRRYKRGGSITMFDLNKFKRCNDEYGHLAGDAVLREFASILKQHTRRSDAVGRYGGDEFLVLMPATHGAGAFIVANRIREAIEDTVIHVPTAPPEGIRITTTGGIACYKGEPGLTPEGLIAAADQALYMGKREGANRIYVESLIKEDALEIPRDMIQSVSPVEVPAEDALKTIGRRRFHITTSSAFGRARVIDCTLVLPDPRTVVTCRGRIIEAPANKKTRRVTFEPVEREPMDWMMLNEMVLQLERDGAADTGEVGGHGR